MKILFFYHPFVELSKEYESLLLDIGLLLTVVACVMIYVMSREYKNYLEDHNKVRFNLWNFIKRERSYIYLLLGIAYVLVQAVVVSMLAIGQ